MTKMDYIAQYRQLHSDQNDYGASSIMHLEEARLLINELKPATVLDYGCGKASLIKRLAEEFPKIEFYGYDPAIQGREKLPIQNADLVINTDVLEHIPINILPEIVQEIAGISQHVFFNLFHAPAIAILPNGENAHCTVKPPLWYYDLFSRYFKFVYPLRGRSAVTSAVVTFPLPVSVHEEYNRILRAGEGEFEEIADRLQSIDSRLCEIERREEVQLLGHDERISHNEQVLEQLIREQLPSIRDGACYGGLRLRYIRYKILSKVIPGRAGERYKKKRLNLKNRLRKARNWRI